MSYLFVTWKHKNPEDPVSLYSELDEARWEVRKVEVWSNGRMGFADHQESSESTRLGLVPVPPVEEILKDSQFSTLEITAEEFERLWETAHAAKDY